MSETKHTPGPWREYAPSIRVSEEGEPEKWETEEHYRRIDAGRGYHCRKTEEERALDGFGLTGSIRPEDARLIAAAPEMLEALEQICAQAESWHKETGHEDDDPLIQCDGICALIPKMRAAIRKAKGE